MTPEEFVQHHGGDSDVELVDGVVVRLPMNGFEHGIVCGNASSILREWVKPKTLGRVLCNDTFIRTKAKPASYRGADVCFISYLRMPLNQPRPKGPLETPPELVIEVLSPLDQLREVARKVDEYLAADVIVVVVLDPEFEAATVYRQGDTNPQLFRNGDELTLPDVLPGFSVPVRKFFE